MIEEFVNLKFFIEIFLAFFWVIISWIFTKKYWKQEIEIKSDYLKVPINNSLIVLGLIIPILVALVSYLYIKNPEGTYSSLLATIILYFFVLLIAIWQTFSIISVASKDDTIKIEIPKDRKIITSMAWMYGLLILGLLYFAIFFLFEIEFLPKKVEIEEQISDFILLEKPQIKINQSKDQIIEIWGEPISYLDIEQKRLKYKSKDSVIYLDFDNKEILYKILKIKKGNRR